MGGLASSDDDRAALRRSPGSARACPARVLAQAATLLFLGCSREPLPQNFLLIIADDVGVDKVGAYAASPSAGPTPNIDRLAREGVLFTNAWANPLCSASRATILTGSYGFRTRVGSVFTRNDDGALQSSVMLPRILAPRYASAALGKWHLVGRGAQYAEHPCRVAGFDFFAGNLFKLRPDYYSWTKSFAGSASSHPELYNGRRYATRNTADDAIAQIRHLREPWLLWVAFDASHSPYHVPPAELYHLASLEGHDGEGEVPRRHRAMTEAMDVEIGRLTAALRGDDRDLLGHTTIIFVSDNGTQAAATLPPFDPLHAKQSVYEGGVRVPLIIRSPLVRTPGSRSGALVNTTDIFATVAEIAGVPSPAPDSRSLLPYLEDPSRPSLRGFVYAELFEPNQAEVPAQYDQAIRGERYKLIRRDCRFDQLFDLEVDPFEQDDRLRGSLSATEADAYRRLSGQLEKLLEEHPCRVLPPRAPRPQGEP